MIAGSQQRQRIEENSKQWRRPEKVTHLTSAFSVCQLIVEENDARAFTSAVWSQYARCV